MGEILKPFDAPFVEIAKGCTGGIPVCLSRVRTRAGPINSWQLAVVVPALMSGDDRADGALPLGRRRFFRARSAVEGAFLITALSVLLPVYNAQHGLETGVAEILELLPELADRFELCILDDGSTDDTAEVARGLAARYPQISVIRHPVRLGLAEAIQTGLDHTQGEIIWIGDEDYSLEPDDLRTLWQLRDTQRRRSCHAGLVADNEPWMDKLLAWKPGRSGSRRQRGLQIVRRQTFEHFRLEQALAMIARVDRGNRGSNPPGTLRPNFLGKPKHVVRGE